MSSWRAPPRLVGLALEVMAAGSSTVGRLAKDDVNRETMRRHEPKQASS